MKKVLVFGTFDGIHPGHVHFLKHAKALGDFLIVAVSRNENVMKLKNRLPKNDSETRMKIVKESDLADKVVLSDENLGTWEIIKKYKPDVIALGYDQVALGENLKTNLGKFDWQLEIKLINALEPDKFHSSIINS